MSKMGPRHTFDPAIVRAAEMNSKRHLYFRWTPRTAGISFMYIVVVPSILGYIAYKSDGLIDFQAKRKGDTFLER